jgi:predicted acylesterase/phospholipase RssA
MAHVGFLQHLFETDHLSSVDTIVASSIGSVIGSLFLIGYTPLEIKNLMNKVNMSLMPLTAMSEMTTRTYGAETGNDLVHFLEAAFDKKIGKDATFKDLFEKRGSRMIITATNLNRSETRFFSVDTDPHTKILDACRMSMSLPFLFTPVPYQGSLYIDGSILNNYPITFAKEDFRERYPDASVEDGVLGMNIVMHKRETGDFINYAIQVPVSCMLNMQRKTHSECTINIDLPDIDALNFALSTDERDEIFKRGHFCESDIKTDIIGAFREV